MCLSEYSVCSMRRQDAIRVLLFVLFFSVGAAALYVSMCCDELIGHYRNKQMLQAMEESKSRLESLIADYDALTSRLEGDPNLVIERVAPAALGTEPADSNAIYPKVTAEQLAAAKQALTEDIEQDQSEPAVPEWLSRCDEPRRRVILFLAGAFLILVSFVWFGSGKQRGPKQL